MIVKVNGQKLGLIHSHYEGNKLVYDDIVTELPGCFPSNDCIIEDMDIMPIGFKLKGKFISTIRLKSDATEFRKI